MGVIKSGSSTNQMDVDSTSNAARVTLYDTNGTPVTKLNVVPSTNRTVSGVYSYNMVDVAGQASAYVFLTLLNPSGSGKLIAVLKFDYVAYAVAVAVAKSSKTLSRISSHSSGSAVSSGVVKYDTTYGSSIAELKTTNPTVGQVADIKSFPPAIVITAAGTFPAVEIDYNPINELEQIILREGEGVSLYQTVNGDTDETMDLRIVWMEYT